MANLAIHLVLLPGKNFHFPEKVARHRSQRKKGDKEANKPTKKGERKRKERGEK